jgi:6-phosphofructokinase 1
MPLSIEDVSRLHVRGGSCIGTARANPTRDPQLLENTIAALQQLGVDKLITIGGDDTALSSMKLEQRAGGRIRVVHVPKTIDNDLDLPMDIDTFGFQTARHIGTEIVKTLMVDTPIAVVFVIAMGRTAGHRRLASGRPPARRSRSFRRSFRARPFR